MATAADLALRCAVHPSLPAADACPVCARPRCAADAATAPGGGCLACQGRVGKKGPPPLDLRGLVGAGCLAGLVAAVGGQIASQYVDTGAIGWLVMLFLGVVVSMAAEYGAGKARGPRLRYLAVAYSVLAAAVAFQSPQAAGEPFELSGQVLGSYALAAVASWVWTLPPRPKKKPSEPGRAV